MSLLSQTLERLVAAVETNTSLDAPADRLQKLTDAIPVGPVKDALSGTAIGHPLHPMLVTVPIGAVASAIVLDLTGGDRGASRRLIGLGILSALPTTATGLSDWGDTEGAERRIGLVHAASNTVGLALLTGSWLSRRGGGGGRLLALAGFGVIGVGGWLGGHLSYALGVGVDTTAFSSPPTDWEDVCADTDLLEGQSQSFRVADVPVLLVRYEGQVRALGDRCTHRGAPLHEGTLVDGCVECPWHASRFSLDDGAVVRGPATRPQPAFEVHISGGRVRVRRTEQRALRVNPAS